MTRRPKRRPAWGISHVFAADALLKAKGSKLRSEVIPYRRAYLGVSSASRVMLLENMRIDPCDRLFGWGWFWRWEDFRGFRGPLPDGRGSVPVGCVARFRAAQVEAG